MSGSANAERSGATLGGRPPTVGFLVDGLEEGYQWSVLRGAMAAAADHGAHLLCFAGGVLHEPTGRGGERNGAFDFVGPRTVDAVVVMSGAIGNLVGLDRMRDFCEGFRPLPTCSVALELPSTSSVRIDNESGMRAMLAHLVDAHGKQKMAFVRGPVSNEEAEQRYRVYRDVLASHGLPFEDRRVVVGDFASSGGYAAVAALLTDRKLTTDDLDAVVCANDATALGVLDALRERGLHSPDPIAVVGFDDIEESRFSTPSLTTVRQPLYEQGWDAVEMVLAQLREGTQPRHVVQPTELVIRRSCGCEPYTAGLPGSIAPPTTLDFDAAIVERREVILAAMSHATHGELGEGWTERLVDAFVKQVRGEAPDALAATCDELLRSLSTRDGDLSVCSDLISALRARSLPCYSRDGELAARAEEALHQARAMTGEAMGREQAYRRIRAERRARALGRASSAIASAHDLDELSRAVEETLPPLGITRCYVLTFNGRSGDGDLARVALMHAPAARRPDAPSWQLHPIEDILREHVLPTAADRSLVVLPAVFRGEPLGLVVLELLAIDGYLYETLRTVFTAALAGVVV